jgi:transcriptional regulator with XRE-family HTH domain
VVLLRKVIGDALRARRLAQHRTLREVSTAANVSLGYLSEIERGHKEASSELLASICDALGARLSEMLTDVSETFALAEQMDEAFATVGADPEVGVAKSGVEPAPAAPAATARVGAEALATPGVASTASDAVTDGDMTVVVHSEGPLRTRLTAKRVPPSHRHTESLFVG